MSVTVETDAARRPDNSGKDCVDCFWNTPISWRDSSVEARLSPHQVNHVASSSSSDSHRVDGRVAAQLTRYRRADVDRSKRLTSFSVVDILGPSYGSSLHHHHHILHHHKQQQQQQRHSSGDDNNDDAESTSTRSNEDLSSSVLSHDSSTDGPSPTGSDRAHRWTETEPHPSTSRMLYFV